MLGSRWRGPPTENAIRPGSPSPHGHHPYREIKCCRLQKTTISTANNRAQESTPRARSGVESWSPRGVQTPKSCPVASTGVHGVIR